MITLRPGSHVYRLLLLLAIAGEYPMRSLHLLGSRPDAGGPLSTGWSMCRTSAPPLGQTLAPVK